uniref:Uncharacterized protein n=1 Tax=Parascaris equorum TaxID=6256 RepID=A0A914R3V5_PAREQ
MLVVSIQPEWCSIRNVLVLTLIYTPIMFLHRIKKNDSFVHRLHLPFKLRLHPLREKAAVMAAKLPLSKTKMIRVPEGWRTIRVIWIGEFTSL